MSPTFAEFGDFAQDDEDAAPVAAALASRTYPARGAGAVLGDGTPRHVSGLGPLWQQVECSLRRRELLTHAERDHHDHENEDDRQYGECQQADTAAPLIRLHAAGASGGRSPVGSASGSPARQGFDPAWRCRSRSARQHAGRWALSRGARGYEAVLSLAAWAILPCCPADAERGSWQGAHWLRGSQSPLQVRGYQNAPARRRGSCGRVAHPTPSHGPFALAMHLLTRNGPVGEGTGPW